VIYVHAGKQEVKKDSVKNGVDSVAIKSTSAIKDSTKLVKTDSSSAKTIAPSGALDQIVRTTGEVLNVTVKEVSLYEVVFYYPLNNDPAKLNTSNVKEIRYANGTVKKINEKIDQKPKNWVAEKSVNDYDKVEVYYNADEVANMKEIGSIIGEYTGKKFNVNNDIVEKSGLIIVKRKALRMKADAVLIVEKRLTRDYGELPQIYIKATAYTK